MADLILSIVFISSILMFGVFVSAAFCGIELNRKNNTVLFIYFAVTAAIQFAMYVSPIEWIIQGLYPVMMHLPLALLLIFYFKKKALTAVSAIFSAYLCCSLSEWAGLLGQTFTNSEIVYYVIRISLTWALFFVLIKYAARSISAILCRDTKTILIFSIMPAAYYIFDYASTIYTKLLYSNDPAVYEFLPFLMCISYLYFCIVYFQEYEEKSETLRRNQMLKLKTDETMHKIEITKTKEMETARLRHDMRHYLATIASLAGEKKDDEIIAFIKDIDDDIISTSTKRFCCNETVNMIISYYVAQMDEQKIEFKISADVPEDLAISDVDLTSIISNGLENAMHAAAKCQQGERKIFFDLRNNDKNMILRIENTYDTAPTFEDGMPISRSDDHGMGTKSIKAVTEKIGGDCRFMLDKGMFVLSVILWS